MPPRDYPLDPYWMPFPAHRQFTAVPRMLTSSQDMHFVSEDGRRILDGAGGAIARSGRRRRTASNLASGLRRSFKLKHSTTRA